MAWLHARLEELPEAHAAVERSLALGSDPRTRALLAGLLVRVARLEARVGDSPAARVSLEVAADVFRGLGADTAAAQADLDLRAIGELFRPLQPGA